MLRAARLRPAVALWEQVERSRACRCRPTQLPQASLIRPLSAFIAGLRASFLSVFMLVLLGTYVGIGALAHDYGFSLGWVMLSTVLVWAGPSQVIMISALGDRRDAVRDGDRGRPQLRAVPADGGGAAAADARAADAHARSVAAGAFHRRQHVGGIVPPAAGACRRSGASPTATGSASASCCRPMSAASSATS